MSEMGPIQMMITEEQDFSELEKSMQEAKKVDLNELKPDLERELDLIKEKNQEAKEVEHIKAEESKLEATKGQMTAEEEAAEEAEYMQELAEDRREVDQQIIADELRTGGDPFFTLNESNRILTSTISLIGKILKNHREFDINELNDNIKYIQSKLLIYATYNDTPLKNGLLLLQERIDIFIKNIGSTFIPDTSKKRGRNTLYDKQVEEVNNIILSYSLCANLIDIRQKFQTGLDNYKTYYYGIRNAKKKEINASTRPIQLYPKIRKNEDWVLLLFYCHGEVPYNKITNKPITFRSAIDILLKYTAAPLCEIFSSTSMKDKYVSLIIRIIKNHIDLLFKNGRNDFSPSLYIVLLCNYIIKIYKKLNNDVF